MKTIQIQIPDMQSAHCQMRVKNAVGRIPGVTVSRMESGKAEFILSIGNEQQEVTSAIVAAGYTVAGISSEVQESNLQFSTNINCSGCVARVTPFLEKEDGIDHWEVDTLSPDKILTVKSNGLSAEDIIEKVENAGFNISKLEK